MEQEHSPQNNPREYHGIFRGDKYTCYEIGEQQTSPKLSEFLIKAKQTEGFSAVGGVLLPDNTVIFTEDSIDHPEMCLLKGFTITEATQFGYYPQELDTFETNELFIYGHSLDTERASRLLEFLKHSWPESLDPTKVCAYRTWSELQDKGKPIFMGRMADAKAQT